MDPHNGLIQTLLDGFAHTQAEFAAANEIRALRARVAELEAQLAEKKPAEPKKSRKVA